MNFQMLISSKDCIHVWFLVIYLSLVEIWTNPGTPNKPTTHHDALMHIGDVDMCAQIDDFPMSGRSDKFKLIVMLCAVPNPFPTWH